MESLCQPRNQATKQPSNQATKKQKRKKEQNILFEFLFEPIKQ